MGVRSPTDCQIVVASGAGWACELKAAGEVKAMYDKDLAAQGYVANYTRDALDVAGAAVARFARKVAEEAEKITQEDVDGLRDLGLSDDDVFNVILAAAARCFFSKVLDATGTLPDAALHDIPDQLRSALTVGREIAPRA